MVEDEKTIEFKTNDILTAYVKEFADDVKLTNFNLREKAMMCSSIWAKWLSYLYKEKENLTRISETRQKVLKQKMAGIKTGDSILRMKSEDKLAENDETLKKLKALEKKTQTNIDYIERALNILQNFTFSIKNTIETFKLNFEH
jgi:Mg2+ and Co2+ transporter CorA